MHDHVRQPPMWESCGNHVLELGSDLRENATYYIRDTFNDGLGLRREVRGPEPLELLCVGAALLPKVEPEFSRLGDMLETLRCDRDVSELPESIGALRSLRSLYVQFAPLETLPESIGALISLQLLDASASHLRCIPETIGQLRALRRLELSGNMLTSLPESIGLVTSLVELNVANNELSSVPATLGNLRFLRTLRLGHNHLTEIPAALAFATSLERLELQHNDVGWIPPEFSALTHLETLDVTDNPRLVALPAALFFHLGSDSVLCNYIARVEPRLQTRPPSLIDLCLTAISRRRLDDRVGGSNGAQQQQQQLPQELVAMLREPAKRCDGCGRPVYGRPWVVELFHWALYAPLGNALGVPLVALYCTPRCMPLGQERFSLYRPGTRYPMFPAQSHSLSPPPQPPSLSLSLQRPASTIASTYGPRNLLRVSWSDADWLGLPSSPITPQHSPLVAPSAAAAAASVATLPNVTTSTPDTPSSPCRRLRS